MGFATRLVADFLLLYTVSGGYLLVGAELAYAPPLTIPSKKEVIPEGAAAAWFTAGDASSTTPAPRLLCKGLASLRFLVLVLPREVTVCASSEW